MSKDLLNCSIVYEQKATSTLDINMLPNRSIIDLDGVTVRYRLDLFHGSIDGKKPLDVLGTCPPKR